MTVAVLNAGLQTTVQAGPRTGLRHLGVPASGAADPLSMALANRLVGNRWDAPVIEATLLGPTLRFDVQCAFAVTGAPAAATLNGHAIEYHETVVAEAGDVLKLGAVESGVRPYIAVAGGFVVEKILQSESTYVVGGLGGHQGRALEEGDALVVTPVAAANNRTPDEFKPPVGSSWALRAFQSFETAQLGDDTRDLLFQTNWTIGRRSDRMGLQLEGPLLKIRSDGRMPSAPVFPGTVQCPEGGSPYILSVDAGTVGGYPRVAQIARVDRHLLGQLRPGDHVSLSLRDQATGIEELRQKIEYWRAWLPDIEQVI
ncbi:MAG: biotin-dependent carboxyltransferase family protein [Woeseiaceae bacterium]